MGRPELDFSSQALPESRAQITENPQPSSLILVSTSQTKENCLRLALNGSRVKVETVNVEIAERDWEAAFLTTGLEQHSHFPVIPEAIAYAKANTVVKINPQARVLAADVGILTDDGRILGKPRSLKEAKTMVAQQCGKTITQIAGTAYWNGREWTFGQTKVRMTRCYRDEEEIERYLQADPLAVLNAAGGLPITDQKALEIFYERGHFPVLTSCFNQKGEKDQNFPKESYVEMNNHPLLIQTVLGLSPELLKAMKVI